MQRPHKTAESISGKDTTEKTKAMGDVTVSSVPQEDTYSTVHTDTQTRTIKSEGQGENQHRNWVHHDPHDKVKTVDGTEIFARRYADINGRTKVAKGI